jgi:parallel beta-helix repeat protein
MTPFTGLKVYRNNAIGITIHRCHNIRIDQGLFADNYIGIDLDRSEGNEVTNTTIVGQSSSYEALMTRQPGVAAICDRGERVGIDLHTWQKDRAQKSPMLHCQDSRLTMSGA